MSVLEKARIFGPRAPRSAGRPALIVGAPGVLGLSYADGAAVLSLKPSHRDRDGCASAFVAAQSDAEIARWSDALGLTRGPAPFENIDIVVEDASPDTSLALVALARRLDGRKVPERWVGYANRWEAGDVWSTGEPERSWGALQSALVHPHYDPDPDAGADYDAALRVGVAYVDALCGDEVDPADIPDDFPSFEHRRALARLRAERAAYVRLIERASKLDLEIPLAGSRRRRAVRGILFTEHAPTGAMKTWLRREGEPGCDEGFGFMGVYRPAPEGGEITFSVDPSLDLSLETLWLALEDAEEQAWRAAGLERPRDAPRDLKSFRDGKGVPSNQPWYDENGRYTLVASPRSLASDQPGSRLSWDGAIDVVWRTLSPDVCVRRRDGAGEVASLTRIEEAGAIEERPDAGPTLRLFDLVRDCDRFEPLAWSDTAARACAALAEEGRVRFDDLPRPGDFDLVEGRGGLAVVTGSGVLLLETAPGAGYPARELRRVVEEVAAVLASASDLAGELYERAPAALRAAQRGGFRNTQRQFARVLEVLMKARTAWPPGAESETDPFARALRATLERRWGAEARFRRVVEEAEDVRDKVMTLSGLRQSRLINGITVYGFPVAALSNLFSFVFLPLVDRSLTPAHDTSGLLADIAARTYWPGLVIFSALVAAWGLFLVVRGLLEPTDIAPSALAPRTRRRGERSPKPPKPRKSRARE